MDGRSRSVEILYKTSLKYEYILYIIWIYRPVPWICHPLHDFYFSISYRGKTPNEETCHSEWGWGDVHVPSQYWASWQRCKLKGWPESVGKQFQSTAILTKKRLSQFSVFDNNWHNLECIAITIHRMNPWTAVRHWCAQHCDIENEHSTECGSESKQCCADGVDSYMYRMLQHWR